jgi:uncharacterized integral membrane protein
MTAVTRIATWSPPHDFDNVETARSTGFRTVFGTELRHASAWSAQAVSPSPGDDARYCHCHVYRMTQARDQTTQGVVGRTRNRRPSVRLVVCIVLAAAVVVFIAENTHQTSTRVLVPVVTMPLWLALVGTAAISLLVGWLLARRK